MSKYSLPKFINYQSSSSGLISSFIYIVYISPFFLLFRLLSQTVNRINQPIFIIQNCYLFTVFLLSEVNMLYKDNLMKLFFFGVVLNLVFYYIDDFLVKLIDKKVVN